MLTTKLVLERLDKEARLIERREQQSRSFLIQFFKLLQLFHDYTDISIQDITNTTRTAMVSGSYFGTLNIASPGGWGAVYGGYIGGIYSIEGEKIGIVVGTGVGAPAPTNYALATKIAHGNGAGQFEYGGNEILPIVIAAPNASFNIRRYFTNNSGGSITVNEAGIYAVILVGAPPTAYGVCIARDLVSPGVAVANTELLRVSYVVSITV